jgi:hypothetical protein
MTGPSNCNGVHRRDFLQLGFTALGGLGLTDLMRMKAAASGVPGRAVNCIMVWLDGGPSHYETFDPKPDAPEGIRGAWKSIPTAVPGVHFSERVPELAAIADKFTVVRSICHKDPNHGGGNHHLMTGMPTPVPVNCGARVTFHPSFGSMVSHTRGVRNGLPGYMSIPSMSRSGGPNFLGAQHSPFLIANDPNSSSFRVRDVVLPSGISQGRATIRRELRRGLDTLKRHTDTGVDLVSSRAAQDAFDINQEDEKVREMYGRTQFGQRCLLARRLVEVGVSYITIYNGGWDHHEKIFDGLGKKLPEVDQGVSGLIKDLDQRGMLDTTLVLLLGEFGRTPKINDRGGRDHWPNAMSVLMAGAGIPGGQIVGATDAKGYYASEQVYSPEDFAASLYLKLGIDPNQMLHNQAGRPVQLVRGGQRIQELFV